ncbi:MAG TPA: N-acetylmuramoyl-L-alanine amidase [Conexibacter sp.]|nr:N-acetylmuramoyl-L-alanine amidase [Conexibacter sp.]
MDVPRVVSLLLVVATCALLPGAAWADGGARTFELEVPAQVQAGAGTPWRTPPLHAAGGFELVGAEWRASAGARVALRARRAGGGWSRWTRVVAGEPVWSGRASAVQLRGARAVRGLRVHAVSVGGRAGRASGAPRAVAATDGGPAIVPRSAWDPHGRCRPRVQARYGRVDFAIVHHTESLSLYSPRQSAAMVLAICLFHRNGNGWNDIGYNALVDRWGTVFEGRGGGVEQPAIGAQAGGWNTVSTGVAMIGSYSTAPPPAAALRSLERVLAWKLSLAGVPASGSVRERSTGSDPADNRYPAGTPVRFQRISGHRDADSTDCPGGALYALLPRIRRDVAALLPPARNLLTLSPVGAPIEQAPWLLSGRLARADGRRPMGVDVRVEQQDGSGIWQPVAAVRTGADGIWSAAPTLLVNGPLRAVVTVDSETIASPMVQAQVRAGVRLRVTSTHVRRGGSLRIAGAASPVKARVRVLVERRTGSGDYHRVRALSVATAADGRFTLSLRLPRPGLYRVSSTTRSDAVNAPGTSRVVVVRVLKRR